MDRQLIAETTLVGLRPLGMGSRRVQDSWNEIDSYLRNALGAGYADLFAEPVPGSRGVSWFAAPEGEAKPYSDLDEDEQRALLEALKERSETISAHAATLATSKKDSDRRLGQTLEWALVVPEAEPGRDFLYSVGGEPLLVNWGTRDEQAKDGGAVLQEFLAGEAWRLRQEQEAERAAAAAPPPPPLTEQRVYRDSTAAASAWWLLWLLFGLLMIAIMYLLLLGCGVRWPFGLERPAFLNFCPSAFAAEDTTPDRLARAEQKGQDLERQVLLLQRDLARTQRCPIDTAQAEIVEDPDQEEARRAFEEIRKEGGAEGEVEIILEWQGDADLDLHIICPDGSRVYFQNRNNARCGAVLDVDMNSTTRDLSQTPREHVTWPQSPKPGRYQIIVDNFAGRSSGRSTPVPYKVYVSRGGEIEVYEGEIAEEGGTGLVQEVTLP